MGKCNTVLSAYTMYRLLILSQTTNHRLFQIERVAEDNLKFDKHGLKLSKRLENTEGKGEIAHYE